METTKLAVKLREDLSKSHLKDLRRHGSIPGTLHGKGKTGLSLEVGLVGLAEALATDAGVHTIMEIKVDGAKRGEGGTAVIKSVQSHPISRKVLHVDFERVALSDVIVSEVPVEMIGEAPGIREGGVLEQVMSQIEVKSRADEIPQHIDVDISNLSMGEFIHAGDVPLPEGVELASRPEDIVVAVRVPHVHRGDEEAAAAAAAAEEAAVTEAPTPEAATEG